MQKQEQNQNNKKCIKCKEHFVYSENDTKWIEFGTYSAKVITCPCCGAVNTIYYVDAPGLNVNEDYNFYRYK